MDEIRTFGQWVKHQRKALGLTQANLAQRVACSKSMINKIESDLRIPTKPLIEALALHLKIPAADYARFVHLAQPQLLVEPGGFSRRAGGNAAQAAPAFVTLHPPTPLIGREREVADRQRRRRLLALPPKLEVAFPDSSMVERAAVNR